MKGHSLKVVWARPKPQGQSKSENKIASKYMHVQKKNVGIKNKFNLEPIDLNTIQPPAPPSGKEKVKYPSQNPSANGST